MRIRNLTAVLLVGLVVAPITLASAQTKNRGNSVLQPRPPQVRNDAEEPRTENRVRVADPSGSGEARVAGQIRAMEQMLQKYQLLLQQRLAQAEQLRQLGLKKEDDRLLQQAEQVERQALAAFEKQVQQFERFSAQISETTKVESETTAAKANSGPIPTRKLPPQRTSQRASDSERD